MATLPQIQLEGQSLGIPNLFDRSPIRRVDPVAERLQQRTVDAVLNGTAWLSSKEVGTRADAKAANKHALASRMLKEGRVFAIDFNCAEYVRCG